MAIRTGAPRDCGKTWRTRDRVTVYDDDIGLEPSTEHRCGLAFQHPGDHRCITMGTSCPATLPRTAPHTTRKENPS